MSRTGGDDEEGVADITAPVPDIYEFSGAARHTIPIQAPPGRNGIQPYLNLTYNSYQKNGWVGVGWDLEVGAIRRSTPKGIDYNAADYVVVKDGYSTELAERSEWGQHFYGARIETAFTKYFFNAATGGWEAFAKDGTKYYYGSIAASRQDNARGISKWCLDKVEDTNGNFLEITYSKDQGQIYPDEIFYTGNASLAPSNYIKFHLIDRDFRDTAPMYGTNSDVITGKLLNSIDVQANGERVRTYQFDYSLNPKSYRSVLTSVRQYGTNAELGPDGTVTTGTAMPSIDLTWFEGGDGTFIHQTTTGSVGKNALFVDVNGDGLDDLIKYTSGVVYTYLSIGGGEYDPNYSTIGGPGYFVLFADVNGDGKSDLVKYDGSGWVYTYLSNGDGTYAGYKVQGGAAGNGAGYVNLADVSGDGNADLIKHNSSGWVYTFLSKGDGTYKSGNVFGGGGGNGANRVMFADVNGDGRADLIKLGNNGLVYTYLSNGDGTYCCGTVTGGGGLSLPGFVHFGDINGDGRSDLAKHRYDGVVFTFISKGDGSFVGRPANYGPAGNGQNSVWFADVNGDSRADLIKRGANGVAYTSISDGSGAYTDYTTTDGPEGNSAVYVHTADVDGQGRVDIIKLDGDGNVYTFLANGDGPPDHLRSVVSPYGAITAIDYTPSSEYANTLMPFIIHPISSLEIDDGFGNISTSSYSYSGGMFDYPTREFRGFESVVQTRAVGTPYETVTETKFHQDEFFKGRQSDVELREPSGGQLLSKITLSWNKVYLDEPANTAAFVKLSRKRIEYYDSETVYTQQDYAYDNANGNLLAKMTSGTGGENVTVTYEYENFGEWLWRKTREAFEGSNIGPVRETLFDYEDTTGNLLSGQFVLTPGENPEIRFEYDEFGNVTHKYDANGNPPTVSTYDSTTRTFPETITNPVGHVVNYLYDYRYGKISEAIDANGHGTFFDYDEFGRIKEVDYPPHPDGGQVTTEYHDDVFPRYRVTRIKEDTFGSAINSYNYLDGLGREIQTITLGEGNKAIVTKSFYDAMGRKDLVEGPFFEASRDYAIDPPTDLDYPLNPSGAYPWKQTTFDYLSRPEAVESADGEYGSAVTTFSYSGLSTTITDPDGSQKTETKDHLARIVEVIEHADEENLATIYVYNAAGDLLQVKDHFGNTTTIAYDLLGRKISMNDPDMGFWEYTYDANGNLLTQIDAKLQKVNFYYDELNRLTSKTYSTSDPTVTYLYDNLLVPNGRGRLYSVSTTQATTTHDGYDEMGNLIRVSKSISGDPSVYTTQYTYDLSGKVTQTIYPDGYQVSHTYYAGTGLLQAVTGADAVAYAQLSNYEPSGKIRHIEHANGVFTSYTYDPESTRLTSIVTTRHGPTVDLQNKVYKYTPAGDIKEIRDDVTNGAYSYTYDKLHRLTAETSSGAYDPISYTYSAIGNITSKTVGETNLTYAYDQWHKHAVKSISLNGDDYTYNYDDNGNMIEAPDFTNREQVATRIITYNADNMPVRIHYENGKPASAQSSSSSQSSSPFSNLAACWITTVSSQGGAAWTVDFYYDGDGMRVKKVILGASATYYIGPHFEVKDGLATKYIFAGNLRIARVTGSDINYFHKDHLGSSTIMTDSMGEQVEATEYLPFGQMRSHSGAKVSDYKFTDQEFDAETGLYNYNARLYDPVIGRFISADTIVQNPFDPQLLNRYSYVRNNPLIYVDPSGHRLGDGYSQDDHDFVDNPGNSDKAEAEAAGHSSMYNEYHYVNGVIIARNIYDYGDGIRSIIGRPISVDFLRVWGSPYKHHSHYRSFATHISVVYAYLTSKLFHGKVPAGIGSVTYAPPGSPAYFGYDFTKKEGITGVAKQEKAGPVRVSIGASTNLKGESKPSGSLGIGPLQVDVTPDGFEPALGPIDTPYGSVDIDAEFFDIYTGEVVY